MLIFLEWCATFITWFLVRAQPYWSRLEPFIRLVVLVIVTLIVTFWMAVFSYLLLFYLYIPKAETILSLNFKFNTDCKLKGDNVGVACSFPMDNISFIENNTAALYFGQSYRVFIELEMPESQVNRDIGMFMVTLDFYSHNNEIVRTGRRAAMLEYRSPLLTVLDTCLFAPLYLLGSRQQKQTLLVEMFSDFLDDPYRRSTGCLVQVHSPQVQLYGGRMKVFANFSGLKLFMFHHPILSAFIGVTVVFLSLNFLVLINWLRRQWLRMEEQEEIHEQRRRRQPLQRGARQRNDSAASATNKRGGVDWLDEESDGNASDSERTGEDEMPDPPPIIGAAVPVDQWDPPPLQAEPDNGAPPAGEPQDIILRQRIQGEPGGHHPKE